MLTSLSIGDSQKLAQWQPYIDSDHLRTLRMTTLGHNETMQWAAEHAHFASLSCLELFNGAASTGAFLRSLRPLTELTIDAHVNESLFLPIVKDHGSALHRLSLPGLSCSLRMISALRIGCPVLEELSITIRRHEGGIVEVALYNELGRFPRIRSLALKLDCAVLCTSDSPDLKKLLRPALLQCSVDRPLAVAIFNRRAGWLGGGI